jgi:hypothetical protein
LRDFLAHHSTSADAPVARRRLSQLMRALR